MGCSKRLEDWRISNNGWLKTSRHSLDMQVTILDDFGEQNKVAMRWTAKATHEKDFADLPATHKKIEIEGAKIFHFKADKIKEAWTIYDARELAQ